MNRFQLVDGALVGEFVDAAALMGRGDVTAVYTDLGASAAQAGPWLAPVGAVVLSRPEDNTRLKQARALRYGFAELSAPCTSEELLLHLREQRYVQTADGQRFFFRYADARAFRAMWAVLTPTQRHRLMGPIEQWAVKDEDEQLCLHHAPKVAEGTPSSLMLSEAATDSLTKSMWPWVLLSAAEEADASTVARGSDGEKVRWAVAVSATCTRHGPAPFSVETVAAVAYILSDGRAGSDPEFVSRLQSCCRDRDPGALLQWIGDCRAATTIGT
jgi:hypothetical protein